MRPVMHVHGILDTGYYLFSQEYVTFLGKIKVDEVVRTTQPPPPLFKLERI
jgi:hypothetical protein